jgi:hypothetical protein
MLNVLLHVIWLKAKTKMLYHQYLKLSGASEKDNADIVNMASRIKKMLLERSHVNSSDCETLQENNLFHLYLLISSKSIRKLF